MAVYILLLYPKGVPSRGASRAASQEHPGWERVEPATHWQNQPPWGAFPLKPDAPGSKRDSDNQDTSAAVCKIL